MEKDAYHDDIIAAAGRVLPPGFGDPRLLDIFQFDNSKDYRIEDYHL